MPWYSSATWISIDGFLFWVLPVTIISLPRQKMRQIISSILSSLPAANASSASIESTATTWGWTGCVLLLWGIPSPQALEWAATGQRQEWIACLQCLYITFPAKQADLHQIAVPVKRYLEVFGRRQIPVSRQLQPRRQHFNFIKFHQRSGQTMEDFNLAFLTSTIAGIFSNSYASGYTRHQHS